MKTIVIVDDEENVGASLRLVLEGAGYQVQICRTASEFRRRLPRDLRRLFDRQFAGLIASRNPGDIDAGLTMRIDEARTIAHHSARFGKIWKDMLHAFSECRF